MPFKPKEGDNILVVSPLKERTDSMMRIINDLVSLEKINEVSIDYANYNKDTPNLNENTDLKDKINKAD